MWSSAVTNRLSRWPTTLCRGAGLWEEHAARRHIKDMIINRTRDWLGGIMMWCDDNGNKWQQWEEMTKNPRWWQGTNDNRWNKCMKKHNNLIEKETQISKYIYNFSKCKHWFTCQFTDISSINKTSRTWEGTLDSSSKSLSFTCDGVSADVVHCKSCWRLDCLLGLSNLE